RVKTSCFPESRFAPNATPLRMARALSAPAACGTRVSLAIHIITATVPCKSGVVVPANPARCERSPTSSREKNEGGALAAFVWPRAHCRGGRLRIREAPRVDVDERRHVRSRARSGRGKTACLVRLPILYRPKLPWRHRAPTRRRL